MEYMMELLLVGFEAELKGNLMEALKVE